MYSPKDTWNIPYLSKFMDQNYNYVCGIGIIVSVYICNI